VRAVVFTGAGGNEVVRVEERPDPVPGDQDVLVRVRFAGLNPADLQQRAGRYPAPPGAPPDVPGLEVSGTVEACGPGVTSWSAGDRVFGLVGGGGLADRVIVHERCVARVPDELDERAAAAVPEAFITAHDAVSSQAGLRPGETLLVHGAAGGVGSAALQIGVSMGARALGTVRSEAAAAVVGSLGAEAVPDDGFAEQVRAATGGRGSDVILELVGAPHFPGNLEALAPKGRIVVVGVGAGQDVALPLLTLMQRRATIRGTVLRARPLEEKGTVVRAFEREVVPALATGRMRPLVDSVFPAAEIHAAFDRLAASGKAGKVLIEFA
jgi:putative PIG3 family NAD(P)H quinone oxidoreductase